ncbi:MAG: aldo/keto reductase [Rhizobiales bacterium]|nr:aldo/keto reductase [Hyphomicrobiales bacterium]
MQVIEANGARIPAVGLGTWQLRDDVAVRIVSEALRLGYRHVDTAAMYGNEAEVGEGIRASGVKREDVFLTTKVPRQNIGAGDLERSVEESLKKLKFPNVDLILIHWPNDEIPLADSIAALNNVKRNGLARHIGVSNFTVALLDDAVKLSKEPLVTNQIELHPFIDGDKIVAACRRHKLSVTAYCPVARGNAVDNGVLERIGKAHGKSAAQVSLRYLVQQGIVVIPRTSKVEHLKDNLAIFDFELSRAEMDEVHALAHPGGRVVKAGFAPAWD